MDNLAIEELLEKLAKPIWVWRAARGFLNAGWTLAQPNRRDGAEKRRINALERTDYLIRKYVQEHPDGVT